VRGVTACDVTLDFSEKAWFG